MSRRVEGAVDKPMGAITTADGHTIIPASRRPDGTMRKEIRVRPGYVPQDEVARFETRASRAQAERARSTIPGMIPGMNASATSAAKAKPASKSAKKNENRKLKRQEDRGTGASKAPSERLEEKKQADKLASDMSKLKVSATKAVESQGPDDGPSEKKLKSLRKKLNQVVELRAKVESGDVNPDEDQKKKLARYDELMQQIEEMEKALQSS